MCVCVCVCVCEIYITSIFYIMLKFVYIILYFNKLYIIHLNIFKYIFIKEYLLDICFKYGEI